MTTKCVICGEEISPRLLAGAADILAWQDRCPQHLSQLLAETLCRSQAAAESAAALAAHASEISEALTGVVTSPAE